MTRLQASNLLARKKSNPLAMNPTLQTVYFAGQEITATVTDKLHVVDEWIQEICLTVRPLLFGLYCESRPHEVPGLSNRLATLQLCTQNKCLIVQLFHMPRIPQSLKTLLNDPKATFIGVEVGKNAQKLKNEYRLEMTNAVKIDPSACMVVPPALILRELQIEKPLEVAICSWEGGSLTETQIQYACIDVYAPYRLGCKSLLEMF